MEPPPDLLNATETVQATATKRLWSKEETEDFVDYLYENRHQATGQGFKGPFWTALAIHLAKKYSPQRTEGSLTGKYNQVSPVF
jgi:hypothetical protein